MAALHAWSPCSSTGSWCTRPRPRATRRGWLPSSPSACSRRSPGVSSPSSPAEKPDAPMPRTWRLSSVFGGAGLALAASVNLFWPFFVVENAPRPFRYADLTTGRSDRRRGRAAGDDRGALWTRAVPAQHARLSPVAARSIWPWAWAGSSPSGSTCSARPCSFTSLDRNSLLLRTIVPDHRRALRGRRTSPLGRSAQRLDGLPALRLPLHRGRPVRPLSLSGRRRRMAPQRARHSRGGAPRHLGRLRIRDGPGCSGALGQPSLEDQAVHQHPFLRGEVRLPPAVADVHRRT